MTGKGGAGVVASECPAEPLVLVDPEALRLGVRAMYMVLRGPPVSSLDPTVLDGELEALAAHVRSRYTLESLKDDPVVRAYRSFYWRIGIDPTKTRPSSEALVRRLLRTGRLPRINPLVDAGNIASARHMVPIGLYDLDRAAPPLRLTLARGGEEFHPIGGGPEALRPGTPILVDSRGTVMHVYPHRDSVHTAIAPGTTRALALAAGVPGVPLSRLRETLQDLARLARLLGWDSCPSAYPAPTGE